MKLIIAESQLIVSLFASVTLFSSAHCQTFFPQKPNPVKVVGEIIKYRSIEDCLPGVPCLNGALGEFQFECVCDIKTPTCWMPEGSMVANCVPGKQSNGFIFAGPYQEHQRRW
ncbi:uncharacterized protein LOC142349299 [Convolutriloba macropyga]|uniref:uncharacterized protein LOC142349299 n=1 Tax=Convolutriloba macropyga TaxID=536237 RepID=UPI003F51E8DB